MLLDNFLKPSIVQLRELGQIMHIGNNITQILFQKHEVILRRYIVLFRISNISSLCRLRPPLIQASNHIIDFLLAGLDPSHYLSRLDPLEGKHLFELPFQFCDEGFLIIFRPESPLWVRMLRGRIVLVRGLESVFEVVVGDVVIKIVL